MQLKKMWSTAYRVLCLVSLHMYSSSSECHSRPSLKNPFSWTLCSSNFIKLPKGLTSVRFSPNCFKLLRICLHCICCMVGRFVKGSVLNVLKHTGLKFVLTGWIWFLKLMMCCFIVIIVTNVVCVSKMCKSFQDVQSDKDAINFNINFFVFLCYCLTWSNGFFLQKNDQGIVVIYKFW